MRLLLALALALGLAAPAAAQDKTIYSSLPLQGDARPQSLDVVRAMRMALADSGRTDVRYVSLDDSRAGAWHPFAVSRNARRAVADDATVAYLGEFNSGASAIAIPIVNDGGILQISPSNTYVGLTRDEAADRGEPEKYYPSGRRTYGRVVPADHTQAHALLAYARDRGRKRVVIVHDGELYGRGLADMVAARAPAHGIEVLGVQRAHRRNRDRIARLIRGLKADAMIYGGITETGGPALWRAVHRRNRRIDLFGPDALAWDPFTRRIPRRARARTFLTNPTLPASAYPAAQEFFRRFRAAHGRTPAPYAVYGYEAMALALDSLARGANTRAGALDAFFATRDRVSIIGTYSIDANGDTTLSDYGGYRVSRGGRLAWNKVLPARP